MPYLTTGLLGNTMVEGVRQSSTLSVCITNDDTSTIAIQAEGFFQHATTKVKYVEEFFTIEAGTVVMKNYFVPFDVFEFVFFVSSQAVEVLVWSKDDTGKLISVHLVAAE